MDKWEARSCSSSPQPIRDLRYESSHVTYLNYIRKDLISDLDTIFPELKGSGTLCSR
jgi:hypothetical protein